MIVPAAPAAQLALKLAVAAAPNAVQAIAEHLKAVQCEETKRQLIDANRDIIITGAEKRTGSPAVLLQPRLLRAPYGSGRVL